MKYTYYPGCSVSATANIYRDSIDAIAPSLGLELGGASTTGTAGGRRVHVGQGAHELAISARNLASPSGPPRRRDPRAARATPCSTRRTTTSPVSRAADENRQALEAGGLTYGGSIRVRHLLEVICTRYRMRGASSKVSRSSRLKVASYYGCQIVRPEKGFDDPDEPRSSTISPRGGRRAGRLSNEDRLLRASLMGTEGDSRCGSARTCSSTRS